MVKRTQKMSWKLALDLGMALLLVFLYNKRALGLEFHEIAGLAIYGLFVIHKLLNLRWLGVVTGGLFSRRIPARQKLYWVLDFLLFAAFTTVLVSGILISKVVFPGSASSLNVKLLHYGSAALALALVGIHAGLHVRMMFQRWAGLRRVPRLIRRIAAVTVSVFLIAFGAYEVTSTAFLSWINNLGTAISISSPALAESSDGSTAVVTGETGGHGQGRGNGLGLHDGTGPHGSGEGRGAEAETGSAVTISLGFLGILLAFAALVAWVDSGISSIRKRRLLASAKMNAIPS